jgi:ABC-type branched-subunit amino acid transport system ATPase component
MARTYQTSQLFGSLSVLDNLALARCRGALGLRALDHAGLSGLLAFVGYRGDSAARAADLPHVDRRLVEIARSLAAGPKVLLLDEPAAGLSRGDKQALAGLIRRIADVGITVVLVEHDMTLVMGISDRVVVLDAGIRIAEGTPEAVQRDPAVRKAYLGEHGGVRSQARARAQAGELLLETRKLVADYGAEPVLSEIDLEVRDREMVAVLGANGAGKSTLMRALAGLHRPVGGRIEFRAQDVSALAPHHIVRRGIVLVPEGRQVFPELSVVDNVRLGGFLRAGDIERDVAALLERFPQLKARSAQRAGLLSGGEQQMLALARGLMAEPQLLLLDEPSLGLAPIVVDELFVALDALRAREVTVLLVDQMAALALSLADRAYVIEAGRMAAQGSAETIAASGALEQAYLGASTAG